MIMHVNKGTLYCYNYYLHVHVTTTCNAFLYTWTLNRNIEAYTLQLKLDLSADFTDRFDFYFPQNILDWDTELETNKRSDYM